MARRRTGSHSQPDWLVTEQKVLPDPAADSVDYCGVALRSHIVGGSKVSG